MTHLFTLQIWIDNIFQLSWKPMNNFILWTLSSINFQTSKGLIIYLVKTGEPIPDPSSGSSVNDGSSNEVGDVATTPNCKYKVLVILS